jgi:sugar/nucleoside kinase (ribokinase family)
MQVVDYLVIGHVCQDLTPIGPRLGGTVTFGALTAHALGRRVGMVTSAPDEMRPLLKPLKPLALACIPSKLPTTFENTYTPAGRMQTLTGRAAPLTIDHVPSSWRQAALVHLAPVADEVAPDLAKQFPGALVGITPQGWMRQWDASGRVSFRVWESAAEVLPHTQALVLSIEDLDGDETLAWQYATQTGVMVVTRGAQGCTLFVSGEPTHIPAPHVDERDPTGAGDIFAAAFFCELHATHDALHAARFATRLASDSVTRSGLAGIPNAAQVAQVRAQV